MARSRDPGEVSAKLESRPTAAAADKDGEDAGRGVPPVGRRALAPGGRQSPRSMRVPAPCPIRCGSASGAQYARHARAPRRRSVGERRAGRTAPDADDTAAEGEPSSGCFRRDLAARSLQLCLHSHVQTRTAAGLVHYREQDHDYATWIGPERARDHRVLHCAHERCTVY